MIAASTPLPVIGVPVPTRHLKGMDSLLSIVQMPGGVPVATVAVGGALNAGLLALQILGVGDDALMSRIAAYKSELIAKVEAMDARVQQA
jgi:5-(carboxyamino)imidazole ribonucleotide mutase